MSKPRWWTAGDLDGFLGLGLDNLIQILLIVALCRGVLGYPDSLVFGESVNKVRTNLGRILAEQQRDGEAVRAMCPRAQGSRLRAQAAAAVTRTT
jgi:hypothetical protein